MVNGYLEQLKDIGENAALALIMGAVVYCVHFLNLSSSLTVLIQIVLGAAIYIFVSLIFRLESFVYLLSVIKNLFNRRG